MKKYKLLLFLLLSFFACNDNESFFEVSTDDLKLDYKSVPGGAMLKYSLPNNGDIFSMNIRYKDNNGKTILKSCGYGGDSVLLDGFTKAQNAIAQLTLLDNYGKESKPFNFEFTTEDSAPWAFFDKLEVSNSWNGFRVSYSETTVATGMAHVFYLGKNPQTQKQDTILVESFPIDAQGDTLNLIVKQGGSKNTIIVRTEDYAGYRVRQEIFYDIESFMDEKLDVTVDNFNDGGLSLEDVNAKTGLKYLFDGDLRGRERILAPKPKPRTPQPVIGAYVAGPNAFGHPFIIDLKSEKVPAKIRMYSLYESVGLSYTSGPRQQLGYVWNGHYKDKVPCNATVYGTNDPANKDGWVKLGNLDQDPKIQYPWSYTPIHQFYDPKDVADLESRDPLFVDIILPPVNNSYRYLILVVDDTFDIIIGPPSNYNPLKFIALMELEVFVKKESEYEKN